MAADAQHRDNGLRGRRAFADWNRVPAAGTATPVPLGTSSVTGGRVVVERIGEVGRVHAQLGPPPIDAVAGFRDSGVQEELAAFHEDLPGELARRRRDGSPGAAGATGDEPSAASRVVPARLTMSWMDVRAEGGRLAAERVEFWARTLARRDGTDTDVGSPPGASEASGATGSAYSGRFRPPPPVGRWTPPAASATDPPAGATDPLAGLDATMTAHELRRAHPTDGI